MWRVLLAAAFALVVGGCGTSHGFISPIGEYVYDPAVMPPAPPDAAIAVVPATAAWQIPMD